MDVVEQETQQPVLGKPSARALALLVDTVSLLVLGLVVMVATSLAALPFVDGGPSDVLSHNDIYGGRLAGTLKSMDARVPAWVSWVMVVAFGLGVLLLSAAFRRKGRTSLGLRVAELELVRGEAAPGAASVALRWIVPVALFVLVARPTSIGVAAAVTLLGWLPCLAGSRRSVYDLLAGITVIDPVSTERRADEAKRRAHPWVPPEA